jgi:peptide/nickel transport system permease protein
MMPTPRLLRSVVAQPRLARLASQELAFRRVRARRIEPLFLLLLPLLVVWAGPVIWTRDPLEQVPLDRLQGPSAEHPLGTDQLGRDLLVRILHGGRINLGVSALVTGVTTLTGVLLGAVAAARARGAVDILFCRVADVVIAFPFLLVALTVAGLTGGGLSGVVIALVLFGWVTPAMVARAETLRVRAFPFVEAARAIGAAPGRVYVRHVLPSTLPPLVVVSVVRFPQVILSIAGLSFLGVGIQPPTPEWGALLKEGQPFIERAPHLLFAPGAAVSLSTLLVTLGAERLRRSMNPATTNTGCA